MRRVSFHLPCSFPYATPAPRPPPAPPKRPILEKEWLLITQGRRQRPCTRAAAKRNGGDRCWLVTFSFASSSSTQAGAPLFFFTPPPRSSVTALPSKVALSAAPPSSSASKAPATPASPSTSTTGAEIKDHGIGKGVNKQGVEKRAINNHTPPRGRRISLHETRIGAGRPPSKNPPPQSASLSAVSASAPKELSRPLSPFPNTSARMRASSPSSSYSSPL